MEETRRRRITSVAAIVVIAAGIAVAWLAFPSDSPGPGWLKVGTLDEVNDRKVLYVADAKVFLVATGGRPLALSAYAPHIPGERVLFCRSSGWFESPSHGEKFDRFGAYALGPAERGLDRVAVLMEEGTAWVNPTEVSLGPDRGHPRARSPDGPFCEGRSEGPIGLFGQP